MPFAHDVGQEKWRFCFAECPACVQFGAWTSSSDDTSKLFLHLYLHTFLDTYLFDQMKCC